jgi:hypothetical protein
MPHDDGHGAVYDPQRDIGRHEVASYLEESDRLKAPPSLREGNGEPY